MQEKNLHEQSDILMFIGAYNPSVTPDGSIKKSHIKALNYYLTDSANDWRDQQIDILLEVIGGYEKNEFGQISIEKFLAGFDEYKIRKEFMDAVAALRYQKLNDAADDLDLVRGEALNQLIKKTISILDPVNPRATIPLGVMAAEWLGKQLGHDPKVWGQG